MTHVEATEVPCWHCGEITIVEVLEEGRTLIPFAGPLCPTCFEKAQTAAHAEGRCDCAACAYTARMAAAALLAEVGL